MKFRMKPVVIEATQWFKDGDHPEVAMSTWSHGSCRTVCSECGKSLSAHGIIGCLRDRRLVCPCDWIITDRGEHYTCKPNIFETMYELLARKSRK